jgi:hypothetical protein
LPADSNSASRLWWQRHTARDRTSIRLACLWKGSLLFDDQDSLAVVEDIAGGREPLSRRPNRGFAAVRTGGHASSFRIAKLDASSPKRWVIAACRSSMRLSATTISHRIDAAREPRCHDIGVAMVDGFAR